MNQFGFARLASPQLSRQGNMLALLVSLGHAGIGTKPASAQHGATVFNVHIQQATKEPVHSHDLAPHDDRGSLRQADKLGQPENATVVVVRRRKEIQKVANTVQATFRQASCRDRASARKRGDWGVVGQDCAS